MVAQLTVDRRIPVPPAVVWGLLVDLDAWPSWGLSVRRAELDGTTFGRGSTGRVWTVAGVSLPFVITRFEAGLSWSWSVAGVPATSHRVEPDQHGCLVSLGVLWWAPAYLLVCAIALRRLAALA